MFPLTEERSCTMELNLYATIITLLAVNLHYFNIDNQ